VETVAYAVSLLALGFLVSRLSCILFGFDDTVCVARRISNSLLSDNGPSISD
jgi:hypothetical protein